MLQIPGVLNCALEPTCYVFSRPVNAPLTEPPYTPTSLSLVYIMYVVSV